MISWTHFSTRLLFTESVNLPIWTLCGRAARGVHIVVDEVSPRGVITDESLKKARKKETIIIKLGLLLDNTFL